MRLAPTPAEVLKAANGLPNGRNLGRTIRAFLKRQEAEIRSWLHGIFGNGQIPNGALDLSHWTEPMQEALAPLLRSPLLTGAREMAKQIALAFPSESVSPQTIFRLIHPKVDEAISGQAYDFCDETNATSRYRLDRAIKRLRLELGEGLERGEATVNLAKRVQGIFDDPLRAYTIARTEAARAVHGGAFLTAKSSGVVNRKRWDAKKDACPKCRALAGKIVPLDQDFHYDPEAKPAYRAIPYPPYHPHCTCMWSPIVDARYLPKGHVVNSLMFSHVKNVIEKAKTGSDWQLDESLWAECQAVIPLANPYFEASQLPALLGFVDDCRVIAVDNMDIMLRPDEDEDEDHPHMDFVAGANDLEAAWVRREFGEQVLLVDASILVGQWKYNLFHEAHERRLMAEGMEYDPAHAQTNPLERILRARDHV